MEQDSAELRRETAAAIPATHSLTHAALPEQAPQPGAAQEPARDPEALDPNDYAGKLSLHAEKRQQFGGRRDLPSSYSGPGGRKPLSRGRG